MLQERWAQREGGPERRHEETTKNSKISFARARAPVPHNQFELVDEAKETEVIPPKKKRSKVIKDDDDEEAEWDQDDLEDSGGDDGSAYEVTTPVICSSYTEAGMQCMCRLHPFRTRVALWLLHSL